MLRKLLLCCLLVVVACSGVESASGDIVSINETCPVMGNEVEDDGGSTEWKGKTVGFCCPKCIDKFEAMSDDGKKAALEKAGVDVDA